MKEGAWAGILPIPGPIVEVCTSNAFHLFLLNPFKKWESQKILSKLTLELKVIWHFEPGSPNLSAAVC